MSLIAVYRGKDKIYCMSDSSSKKIFKFGTCFLPDATKIIVYEGKYVIQHCGIGTICGDYVQNHIEKFLKSHPNKNIAEVSELLLKYFIQFEKCSEAQKIGNFDLILLVSGWEKDLSKVYKISTSTKTIELITSDNLIAEGVETTSFKKQYYAFLNTAKLTPLVSLLLSFAFVSNALKCLPLINDNESLTFEKIKEILTQNPNLKDECAAVNDPYDYVVLHSDGKRDVKISLKE